MRLRLIATFAFLLVSLVATSLAAANAGAVRVTGTFSNLHYNNEGDDLLGMEVKIVPVSEGRYQAAILVSDGAPAPMVLADLHVSGRTVTFTVHVTSDGDDDSWNFAGTFSEKALVGTITHASGGTEKVTLPRRCGYWDR